MPTKKKIVTPGWASSELTVVALFFAPWAANYLGIDLSTLAILFGFTPTDAEQVRMLAAQIKGAKSASSPFIPLIGLAYVIGRPWLKAKGLSLDLLRLSKDGE